MHIICRLSCSFYTLELLNDFTNRDQASTVGRRDESNMHIDCSLPYELLALETALTACSRGLEAEAAEIEVGQTCTYRRTLVKMWGAHHALPSVTGCMRDTTVASTCNQ